MHVFQDPEAYFSGSDEDPQMAQLLDEKIKYCCFDNI
jgi:hypothetical protein